MTKRINPKPPPRKRPFRGGVNGLFIFDRQKERTGGDWPRRLIERRTEMLEALVLLPRIKVILTIKVKIIRKTR